MRESPPNPQHEIADIDEALRHESREVSTLLRKLPRELWVRHFRVLENIENEHAGVDVEIIAHKKAEYLSTIVEGRRAGIEEYKSNDPKFSDAMPEKELGSHLQETLESQEDFLGSGQTARVKRLHLPDGSTMAIKYLLTPTQKTLSAEGEHDMLWEVDIMTRIEDEEKKSGAGQRIRVPHPNFFYKNDKVQCYGMQEIMGMTLAELVDTNTPNTVELVDRRDAVLKALGERYADATEQKALYTELESFTHAMHEVCLHGDIKPGNLMADEKGDIYLIDFGQSVDMNLMSDKTREQFQNLQELERYQLTTTIQALINKVSGR